MTAKLKCDMKTPGAAGSQELPMLLQFIAHIHHPRECWASRKASEAGGVTFISIQVHRAPAFFSRCGTPMWEQCCSHLQQLVIIHHLWNIWFGHWEPLASIRIGSHSVLDFCRWTKPWQQKTEDTPLFLLAVEWILESSLCLFLFFLCLQLSTMVVH